MKATLGAAAYGKLMLHALKYPTAAVNGVLLGKVGGDGVDITEAVPLFHSLLNLSAMLEVALLQIDTYCASRQGLEIVGYYQANHGVAKSGIDSTASAIAAQINKVNPRAVVIMVNNRVLTKETLAQGKAVTVFFPQGEGWVSWPTGSGGDESVARVDISPSPSAVGAATAKLAAEPAALVDFDNYLDDPTLSYLNDELSKRIHGLC